MKKGCNIQNRTSSVCLSSSCIKALRPTSPNITEQAYSLFFVVNNEYVLLLLSITLWHELLASPTGFVILNTRELRRRSPADLQAPLLVPVGPAVWDNTLPAQHRDLCILLQWGVLWSRGVRYATGECMKSVNFFNPSDWIIRHFD